MIKLKLELLTNLCNFKIDNKEIVMYWARKIFSRISYPLPLIQSISTLLLRIQNLLLWIQNLPLRIQNLPLRIQNLPLRWVPKFVLNNPNSVLKNPKHVFKNFKKEPYSHWHNPCTFLNQGETVVTLKHS